MTLPALVSFSGFPGAGKDTAADLLVTRARYAKTYMMKPLEQAMLFVNPWIVDSKAGTVERFADLHASLGFDNAKNYFEEVRRLLEVGSEFGQSLLGQDIWTSRVFEEVQALQASGKSVALSGVTTPEERDLVTDAGGITVWVEREIARPTTSLITPEDCDIVVENNGTPKELYIKLIIAFEEFGEDPENEEETESEPPVVESTLKETLEDDYSVG